MKQTDLREQWEARIKDYRASGLTAEKWCAENEVTTRQLWYWLRKFRDSKESSVRPPQWVPVNVHQPQENTESLLLVKIGAAVIEIRPGYNPTLLSDVVRTLQALC